MKKGPEVPDFEKPESTLVDKKAETANLIPSGNEQTERRNAQSKIEEIRRREAELESQEQAKLEKELGADLLRADFIARAKDFPEQYNKIGVEIGGETYFMSFVCFKKDGNPVEKTEDLVREAKGDDGKGPKLQLSRVEGSFSLIGTRGGIKGVDIDCTLPVSRILTCQSPGMLKRLLTETFGGTDEYYGKLAKAEREADKDAAPARKEDKADKKEAPRGEPVMAQIKKAAAEKDGDISILKGNDFTSVCVRLGGETQLRLTSPDMAVWTASVVSGGKAKPAGRTENPAEFIRLQETVE
jgi:hypothetical protein